MTGTAASRNGLFSDGVVCASRTDRLNICFAQSPRSAQREKGSNMKAMKKIRN